MTRATAARIAVAAAVAGTLLCSWNGGAGARPAAGPAPDDALSRTYHQALLLNTPFVESNWNATTGSYPITDFYFVSVLGNAVLLTNDGYDPKVAGVDEQTLRDHTLSTIRYAAAHDINVDPAASPAWGRRIYFDSTMESYFVAAAKLLWSDLDPSTRGNVDTIVRGTADYVVSLGTGNDPLSPGWTTNGLAGGYASDTKMEEMGTRTMPLATALAWLPDDPHAAAWKQWLGAWTRNMPGLPAADKANPLTSGNQAHNIYDTFLVENHGTYAPIYQQSIGAYPGRNVAQFVLAGAKPPVEVTTVPNADPLWDTMGRTGTDAGVPEDFGVADRHHLYGRNVLPITYRAVVDGDPYAARAERMLADHLVPYINYPPAGRLTKFSGEPKYEPEARAEIAMAYLLHRHRDLLAGDVTPASTAAYFQHYSGAVDYGAGPALTVQQTPDALAGAITKPGYVKFAYHPRHDDWLFDEAGASPALLPSTSTTVLDRTSHAYSKLRDGIDATATVIRTPTGAAGYTTLPDGTVAYASGGIGADEGVLRLHNLSMPGVPGLDGDRSFSWAGGSTTLSTPTGVGDGGADEVSFPATTARYVRMSGVKAATQYGFSLYEVEAYSGQGPNLALHAPATASSYDPPFPPAAATDGDAATSRWAVAKDQRVNPGWLAVDLGAARNLDRVVLRWESAYATQYRIEVSDDGQTWRTVASVPTTARAAGDWLNVDSRAGFVVRHGANPITVTATGVILSNGPATGSAGMVIEGHPAGSPAETARQAAAPAPSDLPAGLAASLVGGALSVFNLGTAAVSGAEFTVPQPGDAVTAYQGVQRTTVDGSTRYAATLPAADAVVAPARFTVSAVDGTAPPAGVTVRADGSRSVTLSAPATASLRVRSIASGETRAVTVPAGGSVTLAFHTGPDTPTADLARGRTVYPFAPLPPGMSSPAAAVDGDPATAWRPGTAGRMVVDLGSAQPLGAVTLAWSAAHAPGAVVEVSTDGVDYTPAATLDPVDGRTQHAALAVTARYVAVTVTGWRPGQPALADLAVTR